MPLPRYWSCTRCPRVKGPLSPPMFLNQSVLIVLRLPIGFIRIVDPCQITITFLYDMVISLITRRHGMENNAENQLLSFKLRGSLLHKSVTAFDIIFTGIGLIYHPLAGFKILIAL